MSEVKADITRDNSGFPSIVTVSEGTRRLEMAFSKDSGFTLKGSRRSWMSEALLNALRLIYPTQEKTVFTIPQPLSVVNVTGGRTLLFDDMETLLKWTEATPTVALDNTIAFNGNKSLLLSTAVAGGNPEATRDFPMTSNKVINLTTYWSVNDWAEIAWLYFGLAWNLGQGGTYVSYIRYNTAIPIWQYYNIAAGWTNIPDSIKVAGYAVKNSIGAGWHSFNMKIDTKKGTYISIKIDDFLINLDSPMYHDLTGAPAFATVTLDLKAVAAVTLAKAWFDDLIITESLD